MIGCESESHQTDCSGIGLATTLLAGTWEQPTCRPLIDFSTRELQ
jgi:hypothetical protein